MKILNLTSVEKSEIKYKISHFPDGQKSVTIEVESLPGHWDSNINKWLMDVPTDTKPYIKIETRLTSFIDVEILIAATQALRNLHLENIDLFISYFLGARSDRLFEKGSVHYLKDVITPIINSQGYNSVTVLDPHSDVLEALIQNFNKMDNHDLVKKALTDIDNTFTAHEIIRLVSPDAGAMKKIFDVAAKFRINFIQASKHRNLVTGNISHTSIPDLDQDQDQKYVIVDDICDGGRTFIELAKVIIEKRKDCIKDTKIYLVVTHGIFSAGLKPFKGFIDKIYTTNSYMEIDPMNDWGQGNERYLDLVKQFKII